MTELMIGELLRRHRLEASLTQKEVADMIGGYHNSVVSRIEQGRQAPTPEYVARFIEVLQLPDEAADEIWAVYRGDKAASVVPPQRREDWGEAPDVSIFYGRQEELAELSHWVVADRCRLVAVLGMGGIGKTFLVTRLAGQIKEEFDYLIWRSLRNAPPLETILADCIKFLSDQGQIDLPADTGRQISLLIDYLRGRRCLVILDNAEAILQSGGRAGHYLAGYEDYGQLFQRAGETAHQSCLLLTGREKPRELASWLGTDDPVRSLVLSGLKQAESRQLLKDRTLSGDEATWAALTQRYAGNPLALRQVSATIQEMYGGDITTFLEEITTMFGEMRYLLDQQFNRLSVLEQDIMYWLAINRGPVSVPELREDLLRPASPGELLEALEALKRRSLVEAGQGRFTLQNVVMEYVTERLIERVCEEITLGKVNLFRSHALMKATVKDYIRESQLRLILKPVTEKLLGMSTKAEVANAFTQILAKLREMHPRLPGYAAGNILSILGQLRHELNGFNFSNLAVWQAYLQDVELQETNFTSADLAKTLFADTFGSGNVIEFSPNGKLLAVGSSNGQVRVLEATSGIPLCVCAGHETGGSIWTIAFSPDSKILASGSRDRTIRLWDTNTGQCLHIFREPAMVNRIKFSPNGRVLASNGGGKSIRLWDVDTGNCLFDLQGHSDYVSSIHFSPNGQIIASGGWDHTVRLWDTETGQCLHTLKKHTGFVSSVSFSADGYILASSSGDQTVQLWDVLTGRCLYILKGHTKSVTYVVFSPNSRVVASNSNDQTVRLWDANTGQCLTTLQTDFGLTQAVKFSPNSQILAAIGDDKTVHLWEVGTGRHLKLLKGHESHIWSVAFHPSGETLATGSEDQTIRLWNTYSGQCLKHIQGYSNHICTFVFDTEKNLLCTGHEDQNIRLWNMHDGRCIHTLRGHSYWIWSLALSPDKRILASGSFDTTVGLWDVNTGQRLKVLRGQTGALCVVRFSHQGDLLASLSRYGEIYIWHVDSGECLHTLRISPVQPSGFIAFSPDDKVLAINSSDSNVYLLNISTGELSGVLTGHTHPVITFAFRPDGHIIATGGQDGTVRLWDVKTGNCLGLLQCHHKMVLRVAFSPNGKILATAGVDCVVRLWNARTGRCIKTLEGHTKTVRSLSFSFDSHLLATGSNDKTIRLWNAETGDCLRVLQGHIRSVEKAVFDTKSFLLVSGGWDDTVKLWDAKTGKCMHIFRADRPYERMNITGVTGLTEAQKASLKALGAIEIEEEERSEANA